MRVAFTVLFLVCYLTSLALSRRVGTIDTYGDVNGGTISVTANTLGRTRWYTPYYGLDNPSFSDTSLISPGGRLFNTANALGGQRDSIIGVDYRTGQTFSQTTCRISIIQSVPPILSLSFDLNFLGGVFIQYDGNDGPTNTSPSNLDFVGSLLNEDPGLPLADRDFTQEGLAVGFIFTYTADQDNIYFFDVFDSARNYNLIAVDIVRNDNIQGGSQLLVRFDDARWTNQAFDWTDVAAFQIRLLSGSGAQPSVDATIAQLFFVGVLIDGTVQSQCDCNGVTVEFLEGETVTLALASAPSNILASTLTDVNGFYQFLDLQPDTTYRICVPEPSFTFCSGTPQCQDITPVGLLSTDFADFTIDISPTITPPPDQILECGDCTETSCTGVAVVDNCGVQNDVPTFSDNVNSNNCGETITRTFTDTATGLQTTQTITVTDTQPPFFVTDPQSISSDCDTVITTIADWANNNAGAVGDDACAFSSISNNWNNVDPFPCGTNTITVTISDVCGLTATATASYTVTDDEPPLISGNAQDLSVECDRTTNNNQQAFTTWLNNNADAVVIDNCDNSVTWTNNAPAASTIQPSCFAATIVTFTATDDCGNFDSTTASFFVEDTSSPMITNEAVDLIDVSCSDPQTLQDWVDNHGGATASDACTTSNTFVWGDDFVAPGFPFPDCTASDTVVFDVTDGCGFTAITSATYNIVDRTPPVITTAAQDFFSECSLDDSNSLIEFLDWINSNGGASATDACAPVTWSDDSTTIPSVPPSPNPCQTSTTVTFRADDGCANFASTTARFFIRDTTAPVFVDLPTAGSAECDENADAAFTAYLANFAGATGSDSCGGATVRIVGNPTLLRPTTGCSRDTVVTFEVVDDCGNPSTRENGVFTVTDLEDPQITTQASDLDIECVATLNQDYQNWLNDNGGGRATDSCTSVTWSHDGDNAVSPGCLVVEDVTFTATDICGRSATTAATFTASDTVDPVLVEPADDLTVECNPPVNNAEFSSWLSSRGGATATDACNFAEWTNDSTGLTGDNCLRDETVTFTGCDECNNCVLTTATFTVQDTQPPRITTTAQSRTVECDPTNNDSQFDDWINTNGGAVATDACNQVTWTFSAAVSPQFCDSEIVTFTASDGCAATVSTTATFTVRDSTLPTINPAAQSISVECDGNGNVQDFADWVNSQGGAQAIDVCATVLTWTFGSTGNPPGPVGCGSRTVTFTVTDTCDNAQSTTATYTVVDTQRPTLTSPAQSQQVECDNTSIQDDVQAWVDDNGGGRATDVCSTVFWTNNFSQIQPNDCGSSTTVTFTANDQCGNQTPTTATYAQVDTVAPVITTEAADVVFDCSPSGNAAQIQAYLDSLGSATASDACSGTQITWTNNFVNSPSVCGPAVPVTFTATDRCGLSSTTTGSIRIDDLSGPTFVNFPADVTLPCDQSTEPANTGFPDFEDNCDTDIDITFQDFVNVLPPTRQCPGDTIITRQFIMSDNCNNVVTRNQTIVYGIPEGACTPVPCLPCDGSVNVCCPSSLEPVACNPVPCMPVPCTVTECSSVPCLPVTCGSGNPPIYFDDDDGVIIAPSPIPDPVQCEPTYIYVFDDDEGIVYSTVQYEGNNSSSLLYINFFVLMFLVMFLL